MSVRSRSSETFTALQETIDSIAFERTVVGVLAILAVVIRVNTGSSGWVDEANTIYWVGELSYYGLITELPVHQPHLPLYYLLVRLWADVTGMGIISARVLSAAAGGATVLVAYRFVGRYSRDGAVLAAMLFAFSPPLVQTGEWLRMYALLALAVTLSWDYLNLAIRNDETLPWVRYSVLATAVLYLHPFGIFALSTQAVWAVATAPNVWKRFALPVLAAVPAVVMIASKFVIPSKAGEAAQVSHVVVAPTFEHLVLTVPAMLTGTIGTEIQLALGLSFLVLLAPATWASRSSRLVRLSVIWVLLPVTSVAVLSHTLKPIYQLKYLTWCIPGLLCLVCGLDDSTPMRLKQAIWLLAAVSVAVGVLMHEAHHTIAANIVSIFVNSVSWA